MVEGVVLVACVSGRVGVVKCAHKNVPLPASCRYEAVPNVLRNVLFSHVAGKTVHGGISRRMRATGEEEAQPTRPLGACRHAKNIDGRSCRLPLFAVGKLSSSLSKVSVAALPREKTITVLIKVRTGRIFAGRSLKTISGREHR